MKYRGPLLLWFLCCLFVNASEFPPHPCLLLNTAELQNVRQTLQTNKAKARIYEADRAFTIMPTGAGIKANADLWLKRNIEIPSRGGHYHNFFCDDGDRLELPKNQLFAPGPYRCPSCGRKYSGEKYEGAVRCIAHHWLAVAAHDLALVGQIEQKPQYNTKAKEILLKYARAYPGPHKTNLEGGMLFQSLNEAMWIIPLAQAYDLSFEQVTSEERTIIEKFLLDAAEGIRRSGTRGNWGSWHLSAVGVVGYAIENREMIDWATEEFHRQIRDELGDDGLWPESVHTYHYFPLLGFMYFAEAAWHHGSDLYRWESKPGKSLLSMFKAPLYYAYPNLRLPAINDGWFQSFVPPDYYELAFHRTGDPLFAWVLANGYRSDTVPAGTTNIKGSTSRDGLFGLLYGDAIPSDLTPPTRPSTNFPVLGIATLRSTNVMVTFDYGPFLGHGQHDKMAITLFANGKLWAADYGTPGYGSAILPWYKSTLAHNTVVVDGVDQYPTKEDSAQQWLGDEHCEAVRSETTQAYPGVQHVREVVRVDNFIIIFDQLRSKKDHTYDFCLHSEGDLKLQRQDWKGIPQTATVPWIENLIAFNPQMSLDYEWREKSSGLQCVTFGTHALTPLMAKCPAESGSRKVPLLIARQIGKSADFITVLFPYRDATRASVERHGNALTLVSAATRWTLSLTEDGRPLVHR